MRPGGRPPRENSGGHWLSPAPIDQRTLYKGNSVLRGGQTPRIEQPGRPVDELRIT